MTYGISPCLYLSVQAAAPRQSSTSQSEQCYELHPPRPPDRRDVWFRLLYRPKPPIYPTISLLPGPQHGPGIYLLSRYIICLKTGSAQGTRTAIQTCSCQRDRVSKRATRQSSSSFQGGSWSSLSVTIVGALLLKVNPSGKQ